MTLRAVYVAGLLAVTLGWLLIGAELLCRFEGGWQFGTLALTPRPVTTAAQVDDGAIRADLAQATYEKGVDPDWFFTPPATLVKTPQPRLRARTRANPGDGQENYIWNDALLYPRLDPSVAPLFERLHERNVFAFHSYDGSTRPPYRLYPDNDFSPTPWITDHWGWLSVDAPVHKPQHTIRIGIIGDSTSHNAYGRYLQSDLNAWAQARGIPDSFEVFNGGRQGVGMTDELNVLKYELGPMGLDYTYEYFVPFASEMQAFIRLPKGVIFGAPPPSIDYVADAARRLLSPIAPYSALTNSILLQLTDEAPDSRLVEPPKPPVQISLPKNFDPAKMRLDELEAMPYFRDLIANLDRYRQAVSDLRATPLVSTERWCVWPGMTLRYGINDPLFRALNGPAYWPLSYRDVRTLLEAHNRVIEAWGRINGIAVVNIDGWLPRQPELCDDSYHDETLGQRLRAWIIFQRLIPLIENDVRNGTVPRANSMPGPRHPYLSQPILEFDRASLVRSYERAGGK